MKRTAALLTRVLLPTLLLSTVLLSTSALADRTPGNLKAFTSVCINAGYTEGDKANDDVSSIIVDAMFGKFDKAGIKVNDAPCQPKGLAANKQLNLYFSFDTTESLDVYSADLAGWLTKDGTFDTVDLWRVGRFGAFKKGTGQAKAIALLDSTVDDFIKDWQANHK